MDSLPTFFSLNIHTLLVVLLALIGGTAAYVYYRKTVPPISKGAAVFLGCMRGIYLTLILILLFKPAITLSWISNNPKKISVVIDRSASMSLTENDTMRIVRAESIGDLLVKNLMPHASVQRFSFDLSAVPYNVSGKDTLRSGTDITESLTRIIDDNPETEDIILITDGNYTQGKNPLYVDKFKQVRIQTVGIGDTLAAPDVQIVDLDYDYIVYEQKPATISAKVSMIGRDTASVNVILKENQSVIQVKRTRLTGDGRIEPVAFQVTPEKTGLQKYSIELQALPEETILENNHADLSMEVLKSKLVIGLIASKPNYDIKFLQQTINTFDDCETRYFLEILGEGSIEKTVSESDVLFIQNYPEPATAPGNIKILDTIKKPLCYILSERPDAGKFQFIKRYFPVQSILWAGNSAMIQINSDNKVKDNPLVTLFDQQELNDRFWRECPPINYPFQSVRFLNPVSVLLQTADARETLPVFCSWQNNKLLLLGSGFWRWKFLLTGDRDFATGYNRLIYQIIRWLSSGKANQHIVLNTTKKVYRMGESILFPVQLYDGAFDLIKNGTANLDIVKGKDTLEVVMLSDGRGNYRAAYTPLEAGRYRIIVNAWQNDVSLGYTEQEIEVLPTNREFIYTHQAVDFLKQLAEQSGGHYYTADQIQQLIKTLDLEPVRKEEHNTWDIWQNIYLLIFFLILLSVEWIIRKQKGLA